MNCGRASMGNEIDNVQSPRPVDINHPWNKIVESDSEKDMRIRRKD